MSEEKSKIIGKKCCVSGCENTDLNCKGVHFHLVVRTRSKEQSDEWIRIIKKQNGQDWNPSKHTKICGAHFASGEFNSDPDHPDFLPTIFPGNKFIKPATESDIARLNRRLSRDQNDDSEIIDLPESPKSPKFKDKSTWTEVLPVKSPGMPKPQKEFHHITKQVQFTIQSQSQCSRQLGRMIGDSISNRPNRQFSSRASVSIYFLAALTLKLLRPHSVKISEFF